MTPEKLLAEPDTFDGREVEVVGYFVFERENVAVYTSASETENGSGIWLGNASLPQNKAKHLSKSVVVIRGVFHCKGKSGFGHFGMWPAELRGVSFFELQPESGKGS
ncbi:MAG: hypothetical protein AAGK14_15535 [Verrucomicrobiota bacterium]